MYLLSERDSGCKHARNGVYLSKFENSSYHQKLDFVDVLFMIVRCEVVENYMFLRDSQLVLGILCIYCIP